MAGKERLEVTAHIRRRDYASFYWHMMFRGRASWIKFGVATVFCFACGLVFGSFLGDEDWLGVGLMAAVSPFVAAFCMVVWTGMDIALVSLVARESNGRLGDTTYAVDEAGIHISNAAIEVTHKWSGISGLRRSKSQLLVGIGGSCYLIVPKRAFANESERDELVGRIKELAGLREPLPAASASIVE